MRVENWKHSKQHKNESSDIFILTVIVKKKSEELGGFHCKVK